MCEPSPSRGTGCSDLVSRDGSEEHPWPSLAAADWRPAQRVKVVAFAFVTPDLPGHRRLLREGVLTCQHLRGAGPLAGRRAECVFAAQPLAGADGAATGILVHAEIDA